MMKSLLRPENALFFLLLLFLLKGSASWQSDPFMGKNLRTSSLALSEGEETQVWTASICYGTGL